MSSSSDEALRRILTAGQTLFGRHGFQRTSMADIAREAGIARATLYLRYSDKRALFEALAAMLVDDALADAAAAWNDDGELAANLEAVVLAKELGFFRLINATPHGAELLAVDAELTRRHVARLDAGYTSLLARFAGIAEQAGADLTAFGGANGLAHFVATAGAGLKHEVRTEPAYRDAVRRLARVAAAAAQPTRKEKRP